VVLFFSEIPLMEIDNEKFLRVVVPFPNPSVDDQNSLDTSIEKLGLIAVNDGLII